MRFDFNKTLSLMIKNITIEDRCSFNIECNSKKYCLVFENLIDEKYYMNIKLFEYKYQPLGVSFKSNNLMLLQDNFLEVLGNFLETNEILIKKEQEKFIINELKKKK